MRIIKALLLAILGFTVTACGEYHNSGEFKIGGISMGAFEIGSSGTGNLNQQGASFFGGYCKDMFATDCYTRDGTPARYWTQVVTDPYSGYSVRQFCQTVGQVAKCETARIEEYNNQNRYNHTRGRFRV